LRLTTEYSDGDGPILPVLIWAKHPDEEAARPPVEILGIVDSGASRTLFPMGMAMRLGLVVPDELFENAGHSQGVGSTFKTSTATVPMFGQVYYAVEENGSLAFKPWGPEFSMDPHFLDDPDTPFLLGRNDFFWRFTVTFVHDAANPVFHLDI
jgi:hypothetical protein